MYEHKRGSGNQVKNLGKGKIETNRCKESKINICYFNTWRGIKPEVTHADKVLESAVISTSVAQSIQSARLYVHSSELGPTTPLTRKGVLILPLLGRRGETHSLAGEGIGGPNSDEGTDTLVL